LIEHAPDFAPAHIGLAKSLLAQDKHSAEAKQELKTALSDDPNSTEAKALMETLATGKSTEQDADKK
jgi:Tfp pilus assembly protein PilF